MAQDTKLIHVARVVEPDDKPIVVQLGDDQFPLTRDAAFDLYQDLDDHLNR